MIRNRLTVEADAAAARYGMLTEAWRALLHRSYNELDFGSASQAARLVVEGRRLADVFFAQEGRAAILLTEEIAREARTATLTEIESIDETDLSPRVSEHLSAAQSYLAVEMFAQTYRDIALVRQNLQHTALEVSLAARSRSISERKALIEHQIGNQAELQFSFYDRSNRRWSSSKFIRSLWRHTLLAVYNETVMLTLADHGLSRARVVHQDTGAQSHGMVISFGSNSELPTYSEIRETVFHPNSNAVLAMESPDVSP